MKKNLICVVGRSGSGKDTISREMSEILNMPMIVSCTTREKRENETNGVEHWFISKEEMENINKEDMLAWTRIGEVEYCARIGDIKDEGSIYIIDPNGLAYLKNKFENKINIITVYIYCDKEVREQRCSKRSDFNNAWKKRNESEDAQFSKFEEKRNWDILIDNSNTYNISKIVDKVRKAMI